MSARFLTWAYTTPLTAKGRPSVAIQRAVLVALASHANSTGYAWPSVALLSGDTGFAHASVSRALTALAQQGRIIAAKRSGGRWPTKWRLEPATRDTSTMSQGDGSGSPTTSLGRPTTSQGDPNHLPGRRDTAVTRRKPQFRARKFSSPTEGAAQPPDTAAAPNDPNTNPRATFMPGTGWVYER